MGLGTVILKAARGLPNRAVYAPGGAVATGSRVPDQSLARWRARKQALPHDSAGHRLAGGLRGGKLQPGPALATH